MIARGTSSSNSVQLASFNSMTINGVHKTLEMKQCNSSLGQPMFITHSTYLVKGTFQSESCVILLASCLEYCR